ncbi:hypothetical protein [Salinimicrobium sp. GXAS 041]|uniref:hypothetical protein n=1 Tax=Salinimicrobium sp. GXAS 041 TaxID=3400806 RepID=UPI003C71D2DF
MKTFSKIFLCTFAVASFISCEPEELPQDEILESTIEVPTQPVGDTGGNEGDVYDKRGKDD